MTTLELAFKAADDAVEKAEKRNVFVVVAKMANVGNKFFGSFGEKQKQTQIHFTGRNSGLILHQWPMVYQGTVCSRSLFLLIVNQFELT